MNEPVLCASFPLIPLVLPILPLPRSPSFGRSLVDRLFLLLRDCRRTVACFGAVNTDIEPIALSCISDFTLNSSAENCGDF
jgi:hypothetical protein